MTAVTRPRQLVVDTAMASGLCVLDLVVSTDPRRSGGIAGGAATPVYAAAGYLLLLWRRRFPGWVLAGMVAHSVLASVLSHGYVPTLGVWLALYTVSALRGREVALAGLAAALLAAVFNVIDVVDKQAPDNKSRSLVISAIALLALNLVIFGVGRWTAWSARQRRLVADRAAADAVLAERSRIARDLHDIVAHSVTLMLLQSNGAARLLRRDPPRAEAALRQVDDLGQQAIVELHHMLGLLSGTGSHDPPDTPQRLSDIAKIVEHIDAGDLEITLATTGEPTRLDASVEVSAYRIVQEALTNAVRYADRRHPAHIEVCWRGNEVEIAVTNHISPSHRRRLSTGHGLISMRERAYSTQGTFGAGPDQDGRFAVNVTLPAANPLPAGSGSAGDPEEPHIGPSRHTSAKGS